MDPGMCYVSGNCQPVRMVNKFALKTLIEAYLDILSLIPLASAGIELELQTWRGLLKRGELTYYSLFKTDPTVVTTFKIPPHFSFFSRKLIYGYAYP